MSRTLLCQWAFCCSGRILKENTLIGNTYFAMRFQSVLSRLSTTEHHSKECGRAQLFASCELEADRQRRGWGQDIVPYVHAWIQGHPLEQCQLPVAHCEENSLFLPHQPPAASSSSARGRASWAPPCEKILFLSAISVGLQAKSSLGRRSLGK